MSEQSKDDDCEKNDQQEKNDQKIITIEKNNWRGSVSQYGDDKKVEVTNQISENVRVGAYGTTGKEFGATMQFRFK